MKDNDTMSNDTMSNCVPKLRFPGFEGNWEVKKLGEIGSTYAGLSGKSKEDFVDGNAKFITFLNVLNNVVIDNSMHQTVKIRDNENQNDVRFGDLLFNTSSETPEEVGLCSMQNTNIPNLYLNSFCFGYRFYAINEYYPLFLAYFFRSIYGRTLMTKLAQGATRYNLSKSNFLKAEIAFPPTLAEQQKIADCLSSLDELIAANQQQVDSLKAHKKGLMQQLFPQEGKTTPKLRFPGFEGDWVERALGDSFKERNEKNRSDLPLLSLGEEGLKLQSETDRKDNSNADKSKYLRVSIGDIAYNTMRMWQGRCVLAQIEGIVSPAYTVCKPQMGSDGLFHFYLFKTQKMIQLFHQNSQGLVKDTLNLKFDAFAKIKYMLPPTLAEQQKIADCLSALDEEIAVQEQKVEALKEHKKGLMQKLFPQPTK